MAPKIDPGNAETDGSIGLSNGNRGKDAPVETPPSPPATETESESDVTTPFPALETEPQPQPPQPWASESESRTQRPARLDTNVSSPGRTDPPLSSTSSSSVISPVTSPPYWPQGHRDPPTQLSHPSPAQQQQQQQHRRPPQSSQYHQHQRSISQASIDSLPPGGIVLQDNEQGADSDDRNGACWAKNVEIVDYVIVNGAGGDMMTGRRSGDSSNGGGSAMTTTTIANIGAFVVWNIRVETLGGSYLSIRKRYSEFDDLRWRLVRTFPGFEAAVPELPPKSLISKFRPRFLEKRRAGLQYFLNCIMLNPEFSGSPVLKEFLFS